MLKKLNGDFVLLSISILSILSVVVALITQYYFNMQPCAWCILQRFIFIVIGLLSMFFYFNKKIQKIGLALISFLSSIGMMAAIYQFFVASKSFECKTSLAEKIITNLQLDVILPSIFEIKALCAESSPEIFGIPFVILSLLLFSFISNISSISLVLEIKKMKN